LFQALKQVMIPLKNQLLKFLILVQVLL